MFRIGQDIDDITGRQALAQQAVGQCQAVRCRELFQSTQDRFAIFNGQGCIAWKGRVRRANGLGQLGLKIVNQLRRIGGDADLLAVRLVRSKKWNGLSQQRCRP